MKFALVVFSVASCFGQAISLTTGSGAATGTLSSFPLGSGQYAMRFHGLPSSAPGSDLILFQINTFSSNYFRCEIPSGTLSVACFSSYGTITGPPVVPLNGATDVRLIVTRQQSSANTCNVNGTMTSNCSQIRVDLWKGDCSGYEWSTMPENYGTEPATSSLGYQLGGSNVAVDFFRAYGFPASGIGTAATCPADAPTAIAPNMDFRFEGNTLADVSGNHYTLSASGSSFTSSPAYNPACLVVSSSTAPRPVVPLAAFTLTSASITLNSAANGNVPSSFAWTQTGGPSATIASAVSASTTVTPSADGSYTFQLQVGDGTSTSTCSFNIGVVNSDANGVKIQTNSELGSIIGPIPRFGTSPWPWFEQTEATDADVLAPYYAAAPAPATQFTGNGTNDAFFSGRGAFTGLITDTYDVEICSTGTPDSYCWRKNGGSWSAAIPITETTCYGDPRTLNVTDGVIICFSSSTGHTLNDRWTRMAPLAGTASVSASGNNHTDSATGYICGGSTAPCAGAITVVGTSTHWSTGTSAQKVCAGAYYWFVGDFVGDSQGIGRYFMQVQSVTDDTHLAINGNSGYWPVRASLSGSMSIQQVGDGCGASASSDFYQNFTGLSQPNSSLNYYEAGLGIIRLAQATNLQAYTTEAQGWCNLWWQYGMGQGYNIIIPRNAGWQTMMACASLFGYTNWWGTQPSSGVPGTGLAYNLTYFSVNPTSPVSRDNLINYWDIRETAYATRATAIMTDVYPAHTASPGTTRVNWCGYSANLANNIWLNPWTGNGGLFTTINGGQDAYWQDSLYGTGGNIANPGAGNPPGNVSSALMGTSPWRDSGLSNTAIIQLQAIMASPSDCNNPALAASLEAAATQVGSFIWDYGRSPDGGLYYNVQYLSDSLSEPSSHVIHNYNAEYNDGQTGGAITVSGTSVTWLPTAETGLFTKRFGPCNGTTQININGTNYTVTGCSDDNHLTLASSAGSGTYGSYSWYNPATIHVTSGSTTVTGTGTGFQSMFACNGTDYIGILGAAGADNGVYLVASCPSQTTLTLSSPWVGASQAAQKDFAWSHAASTNCAPSIGTCEADVYSGKNLAHDWAVSLGRVYQWTQSTTWKSRVEYALGSLYGAPAAGPAFLGSQSGPQSALGPANFDGVMPSCFTTKSVQPCTNDGNGDGLLYGLGAKPFGMSAGAGNARNAIADYLLPASVAIVQLPSVRNEIVKSVGFK